MPYFAPDGQHRERDQFNDWRMAQEVQPGSLELNDYDFERPSARMEVRSAMPRPHSEEVTMKVNGKRIRADFVAKDANGRIHVFEVKHGSGKLTKNQSGANVFDMNRPANTTQHLGGGVLTPSAGKNGAFTVDTKGNPGIPLGGKGSIHNATFNLLIYK